MIQKQDGTKTTTTKNINNNNNNNKNEIYTRILLPQSQSAVALWIASHWVLHSKRGGAEA
jgi:hypothetical protein